MFLGLEKKKENKKRKKKKKKGQKVRTVVELLQGHWLIKRRSLLLLRGEVGRGGALAGQRLLLLGWREENG